MVLLLVCCLLGLDWWIKKQRVLQRSSMSGRDFLQIYSRTISSLQDEAEVLRIRRQLADELSLPADKLIPTDRLTELRDRYTLVIRGHLALDDLLEDLHRGQQRSKAAAAQSKDIPETVGQYIKLAIEARDYGGDAVKTPE